MTGTTSRIALAVVLVGCTAGDPAEPHEDGFTMAQHDGSTIEASLVEGDASLHVLVVETEPGVVDVTFDFGDPIIAFALDYNQGLGDFMPSGGVLDAAQKRLVDRFMEEISKVIELDSEKQSRVEFVAIRQGSFMQIVPAGEVLAQGKFQSARGWTHISCSCFNQNLGGGTYRVCGKGCGCGNYPANGCAGRCGQGCGGTSSPPCTGTTVYTRDCGKHDYGLGSWWAASDDYSFASNNCSCGGNCY